MQRAKGRGLIGNRARQKKKQKYELERGEKFLRFTRLVCDCDQGSEEEEQQQQHQI